MLERRRHDYLQYKYRRILFKYRPDAWVDKLTLIVNSEYHAVNPTLGWEKVARGMSRSISCPAIICHV